MAGYAAAMPSAGVAPRGAKQPRSERKPFDGSRCRGPAQGANLRGRAHQPGVNSRRGAALSASAGTPAAATKPDLSIVGSFLRTWRRQPQQQGRTEPATSTNQRGEGAPCPQGRTWGAGWAHFTSRPRAARAEAAAARKCGRAGAQNPIMPPPQHLFANNTNRVMPAFARRLICERGSHCASGLRRSGICYRS